MTNFFSGVMKMNRSCLMEGFKNARKGTSIAAQATGISLGAVSELHSLKCIKSESK